jgi:aspartate/methionine/tyrosine aminotransferase
VKVKAVLICNPSNPVGRFYSREALVEIARFCGERGLHLVSDEIFAMSCFDSEEEGGLDTFTSVLSIPDDVEKNVKKENIHALYGASKDFGMGGLRLGFLVSRNGVLKETCRKIK